MIGSLSYERLFGRCGIASRVRVTAKIGRGVRLPQWRARFLWGSVMSAPHGYRWWRRRFAGRHLRAGVHFVAGTASFAVARISSPGNAIFRWGPHLGNLFLPSVGGVFLITRRDEAMAQSARARDKSAVKLLTSQLADKRF